MTFARAITAISTLATAGGFAVAVSAQDAMMSDDEAMMSDDEAAMAEEAPMVGGAPMLPSRTIVENASQASNLTTLVSAVKQAGLVDTLSGEGPFTVFAPVNSAFAALPQDDVQALMSGEHQDRLRQILTCHVVDGRVMSDAIAGMVAQDGGAHQIDTLGGCTLTVRNQGGNLTIEDGQGRTANVVVPDVRQSNGVVHAIDKVLLPALQ